MTIHLRQIALVADQLEPALIQLTEVLGIRRCYVDEGVAVWGLENTLMPIGTDFLEVVAPTQPGKATAAGRYLQRRGGDGGYMVITQVDNANTQDQYRRQAIEQGVRIAFERDRDNYHLMQLHPGDMQASFLEIDSDQHGDFSGYWHPAGGLGWETFVDRSRVSAIAGAQLQSDDPDALAAHWAAVLGTDVITIHGDPAVRLGASFLTFTPA
ncbi:MAG: VOC family protein, partial [Burkholderiaceae bacterium]